MTFVSIDFETANYSRASICAAGMAVFVDGVLTEAPYRPVRPPKGHGWFLEMDRQPHEEGLLRLFETQRDRSTRRGPVTAEARRGGGSGAWQRH